MDTLINRIEQLTPQQRRNLAQLLGSQPAGNEPGERIEQLIAYAIPAADTELNAKALRDYLRDHLPDYMIPTAYVSLSSFPLTPNGKIARQALPKPEPDWEADNYEFIDPRNPTEEDLAEIWGQALGTDLISVNDNFFDLGGHSLLVTQIISQIRAKFEIDIPVRVFYNAPTIAALAERIQVAQWAIEDDSSETSAESSEDFEEFVL